MRIASLALVAALIVVAGCSGNKGKIENTPDTAWVSTAQTYHGEDLPARARGMQFLYDGHLLYTIAGKTYKGNYVLGMGPAVTFTLDEDLEGRKIHAHKVVIDGDQLTLTSADGSELIFQKVNINKSPE